jgi:hypothetical protein
VADALWVVSDIERRLALPTISHEDNEVFRKKLPKWREHDEVLRLDYRRTWAVFQEDWIDSDAGYLFGKGVEDYCPGVSRDI